MKKELSSLSPMLLAAAGCVKLGQPVPESNLSFDLKSSAPQHNAFECAGALLGVERARKGALGAVLARDAKGFGIQKLPPLGVGFLDFVARASHVDGSSSFRSIKRRRRSGGSHAFAVGGSAP
jgi:hypothetical protein